MKEASIEPDLNNFGMREGEQLRVGCEEFFLKSFAPVDNVVFLLMLLTSITQIVSFEFETAPAPKGGQI